MAVYRKSLDDPDGTEEYGEDGEAERRVEPSRRTRNSDESAALDSHLDRD